MNNPGMPGFGYIVLGYPYEAKFKQVGQYHAISLLPTIEDEAVKATRLCVFLGQGKCMYMVVHQSFTDHFLQLLPAGRQIRSHMTS